MRKLILGSLLAILLICGSVWGYQVGINGQPDPSKPYLTVNLVYNFDVYERPIFFMPKSHPSYVIWLEEKESGYRKSIFVPSPISGLPFRYLPWAYPPGNSA